MRGRCEFLFKHLQHQEKLLSVVLDNLEIALLLVHLPSSLLSLLLQTSPSSSIGPALSESAVEEAQVTPKLRQTAS